MNRYTYAQIYAATMLMLEEQHLTINQICERTHICRYRIETWRRRLRQIEANPNFLPAHQLSLALISNTTYGISEEAWNAWLIAVDAQIEHISGLTLTADITRALADIAAQVNANFPPGSGVNLATIDGAVAHFVDLLRRRQPQRPENGEQPDVEN